MSGGWVCVRPGLLAAAFLASCAIGSAQAQRAGARVALVTGNAACALSAIGALEDPTRDAGSVPEALAATGFEVAFESNLNECAFHDAPEAFKERVARGGSWGSAGRDVRVAARGGYVPGGPSSHLGFRLVGTECPLALSPDRARPRSDRAAVQGVRRGRCLGSGPANCRRQPTGAKQEEL